MRELGWQGIAPATGWLAVFVNEDGTLRAEHVAFWAWQRDVDVDDSIYDTGTGVLGRDSLQPVAESDDSDVFVGYCHESEDIQVYANEAQRVLERAQYKRKRMLERER